MFRYLNVKIKVFYKNIECKKLKRFSTKNKKGKIK